VNDAAKDAAKASSLPAPSAEALAASAALAALIREEIGRTGWLGFERYMELALYAPRLGYYTGGAVKFAGAGDFVTAPELTPLFAQTLARQVGEILRRERLDAVLELGAGSGRLAQGLLAALAAQGLAPRYRVLELSGELRARQQALLAPFGAQVQWLDALPGAYEGVVIANEVLDAMPVRLTVKTAAGWAERGVAVDAQGALVFADRASGDAALRPPVDFADALPVGYCTEIGRQAAAFVRGLGGWLARGAALLIDYGFAQHEYYHPQRAMGTLAAHYRHRMHADVLRWPGLQDITAHVDFTAAALAAQDAGLDVLGYATQARFLLNCGVLGALQAVPDERRLRETAAVQKLLAESEMGELFKVLALGRGISPALLGFAQGDRTHTL
jgi:SAM-dependent MidA family methyltransferase